LAFNKYILSLLIICSLAFILIGDFSLAFAAEFCDETVSISEPITNEDEVVALLDPIEQFVARMYLDVLERSYDISEIHFWSSLLKNGEYTGASVAHAFFFCPEFLSKSVNNARYIELLYRAFLGRWPAPAEREFWKEYLDSYWPRENIFAKFVISNEYAALCDRVGIERGTYVPPLDGMIRVFVARLHTTTLERSPDVAVLDYWEDAIKHGMTGAVVAHSFIFCSEMINRNLTNERYVDVLYKAMLGRNANTAEINFWANHLRNGTTRHNLFVNFVNSMEFDQICKTHGVVRGIAPPPSNNHNGNTMVSRIWNLIIDSQFSGISDRPEHIAGIIGNLQSEAGTSLCPFQQELGNNRAGLGLMQWSFGRRTSLENFLWSNGVSQADFNTEMNKHLTTICNNPAVNHPMEILDTVLKLQVNFLFHELKNTSERLYMTYVDFPTDKTGFTGSRAYAELFCSLVVRPGPGRITGTDDINDSGVIDALRASPYSGGVGRLDRISYSNLETRRSRSEVIYRQFITTQN